MYPHPEIFNINSNPRHVHPHDERRTVYNFDAKGLQTSMVDRNGNTTAYTYDTNDRLKDITDPAGQKTTLYYKGSGLLDYVLDPSGRVTRFIHDANGDLRQIIDPDGNSRQFDYDAKHRMKDQVSKRFYQTNYKYNFAGRHVQSDWPEGSTRKIRSAQVAGVVDPASGLGTPTNPAPVVRPTAAVSTFTDGNNNTTTYTTDVFGAPVTIVDPQNRTMTINRNSDGNPTDMTYPKGNGVKFTYDSANTNLSSRENILQLRRKEDMSKPDNDSLDIVLKFTYETKFNQVKTITDAKGNVTTLTYDYELPASDPRYGTKGNLVKIDQPPDNQGRIPTTLFCYNTSGQVTEVDDPNRILTQLAYFPLISTVGTWGNLKDLTQDPGGIKAITQLNYDLYGNVNSVTDAENHRTQISYDI